MKKVLVCVIMLMISVALILFSGCNHNNTLKATQSETERSTSIPTVSPTTAPTQKPTQKPTKAPTEKPSIDIDWTEASYTHEDSDGYEFKVTINVSPWILLSNTDAVNAAWKKVGSNYSLPGFNDWGLTYSNNSYYRNKPIFGQQMTDMYYCIGELKIENITEGWSVDSSNPKTVMIGLTWENGNKKQDYLWKAFYSDSVEDYGKPDYVMASLKTNKWGPLPFIIMIPENFTPKYPDGEFIEGIKDGNLYISNERFNLGVIGKDMTYFSPDE